MMQEWPGTLVSGSPAAPPAPAAPAAEQWPGTPVQPQSARPASASQPRGLRNNNPGNIEDGAFARSLPGYAGSDGRFARFQTADHGAQAAPRLLRSYLDRGFDTPAKIINRWAPPSDNNPTDAYARYVAQRVGVGVDDPVSPEQIDLIAQAISEFENGQTVPSTPQPREARFPGQPVDMSGAADMALAEGQGVAVKAGAGMPPEWFIANGLPLDATTEDMIAAGFVPNQETGEWEKGDPRSAGHIQALAQERELAGGEAPSYAKPDFVDQFTAPINDELAFAAGAGMQGLANLGRTITGQENEISALDRARAMRDASREGQEQFEQENPAQALGGAVLGGFAFAPARGAAIPGLLGRLGQAGGVGSAYGVAEGDGVLGRAGSGLAGAAISTATAGTLEAGGAGARGLLGGAERMRAPRGSLPNRGERRVGGAIERALERDNLTPQDLAGALPNMPEGRLPFEAGGENLVGLAETMAQAPGRARRDLLSAVGGRRDEASNRVAGRLADSFGAQGNGFQALRQRISARGEEANAGMAQIADRPVPLDSASVQAFRSRLTSPAVRNAAEEAIAELSPEGAAAANRLFGLGDEVLDNPAGAQITVREAQDISYTLNEAASRAYRGGFNSRGEALKTLANTIRGNARNTVPEYDGWLKSFGDASEAIDAMRTGQNVFARANERNAMSAAELAERWQGWSAPARDNYRLGVGEAVLDRVRGQGGIPAMRRLLRDNELGDRVRIAFDSEDEFLRFMRTADDEVAMANVDNQILGGSPTARRVAGAGDLNQQGIGASDVLDFATDFTSPIGMVRQGLKGLSKTLPRRDRSILGNDDLNGLIGRALTDETEMTRLLNLMQTDRGIRETVNRQVRRFGLLSGPGQVSGGQQRARGLLTANP